MLSLVVALSAVLATGLAQTATNRFPDGFMLGAATAAYQIEGAWNEDALIVFSSAAAGVLIRTLECEKECVVSRVRCAGQDPTASSAGGQAANLQAPACDSSLTAGAARPERDVRFSGCRQRTVAVGAVEAGAQDPNQQHSVLTERRYCQADVYRFSISWPRVLPTGDLDVINQAGIDYYNNLINELLANGIQPLVTMYHWDLPQALQYLGGWPNELMVDYFVEYARILFENFGDRAWLPHRTPPESATTCPHTLLKAHARVWHLYDEQYRATQNGSVGITLNIEGLEPATNSTEDAEASDRARQFQMGIYAHPIYSAGGDYPAVVRERVDANSAAEGRPRSRLPSFTQEEVQYIRGSADFIGLNHYSTDFVTSGVTGISPSKARDSGVITSYNEAVPWGFRSLLNWIANEYPGYPIFVTENGLRNSGGRNDTDRIDYYIGFLGALLEAVNVDGVPVIGYTTWTLMDNVEWSLGTRAKFGLYEVDFSSPNLTRTPKESAGFIAEVYGSRELPEQYFR
ncbi:myrosinase 1-like [Schistocerca cancellata]|uniref:myrosinase 1-like n=1 Tax=Schistocerca cancellata TaxID=274614 RepID=UPI0021196816|nr:myrosinase 1-like [Schistocerca cancellata]